MKLVGKVLVIAGAAAVGTAVFACVRRAARARTTATVAGSMFVGAVDEVELSGLMRPDQDPAAFEPEEVPSEHPEINELREKMPFG
jgi:hypothetical protein